MTLRTDRRLLQLAEQIEGRWPDIVIGWDLGLGPARPEDADIVLEVFSVEDDRELDFLGLALPLVRQAERDLGHSLLLLSHDPEATRELYSEIPKRIFAWRAALKTWALNVTLADRHLACPPQAA